MALLAMTAGLLCKLPTPSLRNDQHLVGEDGL